jgi:hypothetical protein
MAGVAPDFILGACMTRVEAAWAGYLADCEEMRQRFLQDPTAQRYPVLVANAHFILQQTQAMAYNLVMATRQNSPRFLRGHFFEPLLYTAHQPNPDFVYQTAFLNGSRSWRISGRRNSAHWVEIQASSGWWGDKGYQGLGNYDLDEFELDSDGSFELIASPHPVSGNWIRLDGSRGSDALLVRAAMYDWQREEAPEFFIEPMEPGPTGPAILDEQDIIERLGRCGEYVRHCIGRWTTRGSPALLAKAGFNQFLTRTGEVARGGANPLAHYGQAVYELAPDEALIIETDDPRAAYWGISLGTWWWETTDPTHHHSSINGHQASFDPDGKFRAVLSHSDPGVANWLDPAGWPVGIILLRWYRPQIEQKVITSKVPFADLRRHLPKETAEVSPTERSQEIARRGRAVMRWYGYQRPIVDRQIRGSSN